MNLKNSLLTIIQEFFEPRLAEARSKVKDPATLNGETGAPRIKLKMNVNTETPEPTQKKLILTHNVSSQTPPATSQSGIGVDSEAFKRQQDLVQAGSTSETKTRGSEEQRSMTQQSAANGVAATSQINGEPDTRQNGVSASKVPPQATTTTGTPLPPPSIATPALSGTPQPATAISQPPPRPVQHIPTSIFDRRFREEGKGTQITFVINTDLTASRFFHSFAGQC